MRYPLLAKAGALGAVILGLTWALGSVSHVVDERQGRLEEAQNSVAASLGGSQILVGPVIQRACVETWSEVPADGPSIKSVAHRREFNIFLPPKALNIDGKAALEPRYRGIFKVNGFSLTTALHADWLSLDALAQQPQPHHESGTVVCNAPVLMLALGDARGIRSATLKVNGQELALEPGSISVSHDAGLHAVLPGHVLHATGPLAVDLSLVLIGTQNLEYAPIAEQNNIRLSSNWPHPSFYGGFLPSSRDVTAQGFSASWQISALATTAGLDLQKGRRSCSMSNAGRSGSRAANREDTAPTGCIESFGVGFIDPVNPYVLSDRATKYGLLFIVLTFVAVGLVEVMRSLRVHPIQYLLVGSALVVFFLLLVSLSEQWAFAWAYLAASGACTALLSYYGAHVLRGWWPGLAFGAGIAALFGALYVLLQLEQGSLVLGSVLLFIVLAAVMVVTRRIDWYALLEQLRTDKPGLPASGPSTTAADGIVG